MSTRFPLQTVLELMQSRADDAARELGARIASEKDARAQLKMLEDYRAEYAERFRNASQNGLTPQQWQNYQEFIARLDDAIGQQTIVVAGSVQKTASGQQAWLSQKNQLRAFDTLAERHNEEQRWRELRREQKATDEMAARRFARDPAND